MGNLGWQTVDAEQHGVISHAQLRALTVSPDYIRAQVDARRWVRRTERVITTTTGPLSREQRQWVAVLHAGGSALVGGLTAAGNYGLKRWERESITVLVDEPLSFEPVDGVTFFRTRRHLDLLRDRGASLPTCFLEPAILLFAAHEPHPRTAMGAITACVQQTLTTPDQLRPWVELFRPLRRAAMMRTLLDDLDGGAQSLTQIDVVRSCRRMCLKAPTRQVQRTGRDGRKRFTDCEWDLPDGRTLVLEVDGAFHADVEQYTEDVQRTRSITDHRRTVIRCTAYELRHEPERVVADLRALGVPAA